MSCTNSDYVAFMQAKHKFTKKYSGFIELDKYKRSAARLVNFAKRYILFAPVNRTPEEIKKIPVLYRFRCHIYNSKQIDFVNDVINAEIKNVIMNEKLIDHQRLISELNDQREELIASIFNDLEDDIQKIPIMINLDIYGKDPTIPILHHGKEYILDKKTQERARATYQKININCDAGKKLRSDILKSKMNKTK